MAETLITSTGSVVFSGSLTSTAAISQLNVDGVSGTITGTFIGNIDSSSFAETASFLTGPILDLDMSGTFDHTGSANFIGNFTTSAGALIAGPELTIKSDPDPRILVQHAGVGGTQVVLQAVGDSGDANRRGQVGTINNLPMSILQNNTARLTIDGTDLSFTGSIHASTMLRSNTQFLVGYTELLTNLADPQKSDGSTATPNIQILGTTNTDQSITIGGFGADNFGPSVVFVKSKSGSIGSSSLITDGAILGNIAWTADDGTNFATMPARIRALVDDDAPSASSIGGELRFEVATGLLNDELLETVRLTSDLMAHFSGSGNFTGGLDVLGDVTVGGTSDFQGFTQATGSFTGTFIGDFTGSTSYTGSFTGGFKGTSSVATTVVAGGVDYADVANKPTLVSSSTQFGTGDDFTMGGLEVAGTLGVTGSTALLDNLTVTHNNQIAKFSGNSTDSYIELENTAAGGNDYNIAVGAAGSGNGTGFYLYDLELGTRVLFFESGSGNATIDKTLTVATGMGIGDQGTVSQGIRIAATSPGTFFDIQTGTNTLAFKDWSGSALLQLNGDVDTVTITQGSLFFGGDVELLRGSTNRLELASGDTFRVVNGGLEVANGQFSVGAVQDSTTFAYITSSNASKSSMRIAHGIAPSSPVDGDIWSTTAGMFIRANGVTIGPFGETGAADASSLTGTTLASNVVTSSLQILGTLVSLNMAGNIVMENSSTGMLADTSDATDNQLVKMGGGGGFAITRGAQIILAGNEHTDHSGSIQLVAGDATGGTIKLLTGPGSIRLIVNETGSLGIGTTTPEDFVHIVGASAPRLVVEDSTNNVKTQLKADNSQGIVGTLSTDPFQIRSNNVTAILIDTSQSVDIDAYMAVGAAAPNPVIGINAGVPAGGTHSVWATGAVQVQGQLTAAIGVDVTDGNISIQRTGNTPRLLFIAKDGAVDNELWDFRALSTGFQFNIQNDAQTITSNYMTVSRTGTTVNDVSFPSGTVHLPTAGTGYGEVLSQIWLGSSAGREASIVNWAGDLHLVAHGNDDVADSLIRLNNAAGGIQMATGGTNRITIVDATTTISNNVAVTGTSGLTGNVGIGGAAGSQALRVTEGTANFATIQVSHANATNPYGIEMDFTAGSPNDKTHWFAHGLDSTTDRFWIWSDGTYQGSDGIFSGTLTVTGSATINNSLNLTADGAGIQITGGSDISAWLRDAGTGDPGYLTLYRSGVAQVQMSPDETWIQTGGFVVGHSASIDMAAGNIDTQILGTTAINSSLALGRWAASTSSPTIQMYKSRHPTIASNSFAAVVSGDRLGSFQFYGDDGTDAKTSAATIQIEVDNTVNTGIVPGKILFKTALSGSLENVLTLDSAKLAAFAGDATISGSLDVADTLEVSGSGQGTLNIISTGASFHATINATPVGGGSFILNSSQAGFIFQDNTTTRFTLTSDGKHRAVDADATAPAYSFTSDTNSGMYRVAENHVGISANGLRVGIVDTHVYVTGLFVVGSSADPANLTTGDILANGGVFAVSDAGASNIDHIWHDDTANAWHFVSDNTRKRSGNSQLVGGSLSISGSATFGTYTGQSSIVTLGTITTGVWTGTSIATANTDAKVVSVATGTGLDNNGTAEAVSLDLDFNELSAVTLITSDHLVVVDGTLSRKALISGIALSLFNNDAGWTSNAGTVTNVTGGTGIDSTGGATPDLTLDVSELGLGGTLIGSDHLVAANGGVSNRQVISSIPLSIFNNNSGWTTNTGTVTSVGSGDGLSGGTITTTGTLTVDSTVIRTTGTQTLGGQKTFSSPVRGPSGTEGAPGIAFSTDTDLGMYRVSANVLGLAADRVEIRGAGDELLRMVDSSATGAPMISFYQTTTRRAFLQFVDSGNHLDVVSEYGYISLKPGSSGTEREKLRLTDAGAALGFIEILDAQLITQEFAQGDTDDSINWNEGNVCVMNNNTSSGARSITHANQGTGGSYRIIINAGSGATSNWTWTGVEWSGGSGAEPVLSTTSGDTDIIDLMWTGSRWLGTFSLDHR